MGLNNRATSIDGWKRNGKIKDDTINIALLKRQMRQLRFSLTAIGKKITKNPDDKKLKSEAIEKITEYNKMIKEYNQIIKVVI